MKLNKTDAESFTVNGYFLRWDVEFVKKIKEQQHGTNIKPQFRWIHKQNKFPTHSIYNKLFSLKSTSKWIETKKLDHYKAIWQKMENFLFETLQLT